jgi:prepilin-type N-terminal cleavage/methylation domain-containing protein
MQRRRAFTLVELLVVIGVILVLAGLAMPLIVRSYRASERASVAADLQAIVTALEQYQADHRDYPRIIGVPDEYDHARLLARTLVAPRDDDGNPGPGFRVPPGGALSPPQGRVWGPYLQPDRFRMRDPANPTNVSPAPENLALFDRWDRPILYFPARLGRPNLSDPAQGLVTATNNSLYNAMHNAFFFRRPGENNDNESIRRIQVMLGDHNTN